jgi:hypothetical protein
MSASATSHRPVTSPQPGPKRAKTLKCEFCRNRKVKASEPSSAPFCFNLRCFSLVRSLFESNPQQCEPQDRNSSNQEKCNACQKQGLTCGPNVPCPPKPGSVAPNTNRASAPSYAAVLSSPAPREASAARTLAIPRDGAPSRPSTARLRPPSHLFPGPNPRMINDQITGDSVNGQLRFIASK